MEKITMQAALNKLYIVKAVFKNIKADPELINSINIAINSLEAWDAVKAEIDTYLFKNEFGTAYRQEVADIIDKHLQEREALSHAD